MTQSCPTPPQSRRRFFLSPKTLRAPWGLMSKIGQGQNGGADSPVVLSGEYLFSSIIIVFGKFMIMCIGSLRFMRRL